MLLTVSDLEIVECPPETLNAPGLYMLLSEGLIHVIDKALLSQPEQCMVVLTKLEEDGELVTRILAALGSWIFMASCKHGKQILTFYQCISDVCSANASEIDNVASCLSMPT